MGRNGRTFSTEFKLKVVQAVLAGQSQATVARTHNVAKNTIGLWLKAWRSGRLGGEPIGAPGPDPRLLMAQLHAAEERIAQLERLVGKKEAELDLKNTRCAGTRPEQRELLHRERVREARSRRRRTGPLTRQKACTVVGMPKSTSYYRS